MGFGHPVFDDTTADASIEASMLLKPTVIFVKRLFDVLTASALLALLIPLFGYLYWRIRAEDKGPAVYVQPRVGIGGKEFACYKFRTMTLDADSTLERWKAHDVVLFDRYRQGNFKLRDDPRVTRIGQFLRAYSLDELPQLVNILRGDMTLIGPRPLLPREIADYGTKIRYYYRTRPGLTGLWQVSGRSETTFHERADLDERYIKRWSIWLDLRILFKTVFVVFCRHGAY